MNKIHDLKITPLHFEAVLAEKKKAELRQNDRGFGVGDVLILREWDDKYSGRVTLVKITHLLDVGGFLIAGDNWVVISIASLTHNETIKVLLKHHFEGK